ncbi:hypothetical protein E2P81_ATG09150 [Venturia nashicola]|nr:hypothetical protein E2P81_ATG09150 [Venturia nashicola]
MFIAVRLRGTGVTKTFDGLTSECSPRYVSTLLGSNLSSAGVKLLCAKSSPLLEKEPATPKSSSSSSQQTSSESAKETSSTTTPVPTSTDQPAETISPITDSSTTRKPGNPGSPVISKGPPPDVTTLQPATTTTSEPTSSQSSTSTPTSTLSEPETSSSSSIVTSSSATQTETPKAAGAITSASSSVASSTRAPVITSTQSANSTTALPAGAIGKEEPQKHKKSSTGPIVGGILGGVALIVLFIIFLFYSIIRPKRRRQQEEDEDYNQKAATTTHITTLTTDATPPKDPIYSAANPYNNQTPTLPTLVTKMPYRSNSQRSGVSELARHDSRLSMRSVNRSNSLTDRYDVSPIDRFGNPMWDPYSPPDRYGAYVSPPMDDRYGPYSTSTMNTHRYDPTGVAPISFMEAEWNQLRSQQPMRQNSYSKSRPNFINYPSVIQEERESVSATSGQSSVYELGNDGNASKTSVRRSEDNNNKGASTRRSEDKLRTGTPDITRKSPLRVVNGAPEN